MLPSNGEHFLFEVILCVCYNMVGCDNMATKQMSMTKPAKIVIRRIVEKEPFLEITVAFRYGIKPVTHTFQTVDPQTGEAIVKEETYYEFYEEVEKLDNVFVNPSDPETIKEMLKQYWANKYAMKDLMVAGIEATRKLQGEEIDF